MERGLFPAYYLKKKLAGISIEIYANKCRIFHKHDE
jgi:hypothetical protein